MVGKAKGDDDEEEEEDDDDEEVVEVLLSLSATSREEAAEATGFRHWNVRWPCWPQRLQPPRVESEPAASFAMSSMLVTCSE